MIKRIMALVIFCLCFSLITPALGAKMPSIKPENWVVVSGRITDDTAREVIESLLNLDAKPEIPSIGLRLYSSGGSLSAVLAICDVIKNLRHPVVTVGIGEVLSGAVLILSCGSKRYLGAHTMVMLHQPDIILGDWRSSFTELRELTEILGRMEEQMYSILAGNTGKSRSEVRQNLQKELWLTAKEAIEYGLADGLLEELKESKELPGKNGKPFFPMGE